MPKFIDAEKYAVSETVLTDWYQSSVSNKDTPIWTEEHLSELYNDFYLIPKRDDIIGVVKLSDVSPTVNAEWVKSDVPNSFLVKCTNCGFDADARSFKYCPMCRAEMGN